MASNWVVEGKHAGAFIVSEASAGSTGVSRSREQVTYAGAVALEAGRVVNVTNGVMVAYLEAGAGNVSVANGVLLDNVEPGNVNVQNCVALVRDCEVNGAELVYNTAETPSGISASIVDLAAAGIIVRD